MGAMRSIKTHIFLDHMGLGGVLNIKGSTPARQGWILMEKLKASNPCDIVIIYHTLLKQSNQ